MHVLSLMYYSIHTCVPDTTIYYRPRIKSYIVSIDYRLNVGLTSNGQGIYASLFSDGVTGGLVQKPGLDVSVVRYCKWSGKRRLRLRHRIVQGELLLDHLDDGIAGGRRLPRQRAPDDNGAPLLQELCSVYVATPPQNTHCKVQPIGPYQLLTQVCVGLHGGVWGLFG